MTRGTVDMKLQVIVIPVSDAIVAIDLGPHVQRRNGEIMLVR